MSLFSTHFKQDLPFFKSQTVIARLTDLIQDLVNLLLLIQFSSIEFIIGIRGVVLNLQLSSWSEPPQKSIC